MKATCQICGKDFDMGVTGTIEGCDKCTGVQHDKNGHWWDKDETQKVYESVSTGKVRIVTRNEAFNGR